MQIGTMEFLVIVLIAFLILGPDKTYIYARKLGRGIRTLKIYINTITEDVEENITEPIREIRNPLEEAMKPLEEAAGQIDDSMKDTLKDINRSLTKTEHGEKNKPLPADQEDDSSLPYETAELIDTDVKETEQNTEEKTNCA